MTQQSLEIKKKGILKYIKLKSSQKRELLKNLSLFYGFDLTFLQEYFFYKSFADKVYIFNGNLQDLDLTRINTLGLYFGTFHGDRFRLSIEGSKFVKPKLNFIILNEKSFNSYITAENLFKNEVDEISQDLNCPFLIVIYKNESLGSVSIKEDTILTYVPKSRKLDYNKVF